MTLIAVLVALSLGPAAEAAPSPTAARPRATRCAIVVVRHRRRLRFRPCPKQRRPPAKVPGHGPPPPIEPAPAPPSGSPPLDVPAPPTPTPSDPEPTTPTPTPPPPTPDPYFLTLYARDIGNGDFRLTPAVGTLPAGRIVLSYKNVDVAEHDLWLRPISPAGADRQLFTPSASSELRRTELRLGPGRYTFLCRMPGHDAMRQDVDVVGG